MNELIYEGEKLVRDKIGIFYKNPNWNTKPEWEMRIEGQIKKLRQQTKLPRKVKHTRIQRNEKIPKRQLQTNMTTQLEEINQNTDERKETQKVSGQGRAIQTKGTFQIDERNFWRFDGKCTIYIAFCLDVAQDHMNGAPNENWTHSWRFTSLAC